MSYTDVWIYANDAAFQGRCRAALWEQAVKVVNEDAGFPAAGQAAVDPEDDRRFATLVLRDEARVTGRVLAMQVLRNSTIAADPATATDADILWQLNNAVWAELRGIG